MSGRARPVATTRAISLPTPASGAGSLEAMFARAQRQGAASLTATRPTVDATAEETPADGAGAAREPAEGPTQQAAVHATPAQLGEQAPPGGGGDAAEGGDAQQPAPQAGESSAVARPAARRDAQGTVPAPAQTAASRRGGRRPDVRRSAAVPFAADAVLRPKSLNLSQVVLRASEEWARARRAEHRAPRVAWLLDAALADLPADVDALRALQDRYPAALYEAEREQISMRIRAETVARVEDAQFELTATRQRGLVLWHVLTAAVAAQLEAEGIDVRARL